MTDYISREAAYESLLNGMVMTGYQSRALDCIREFSIPAADVREVKRGKWKRGAYTDGTPKGFEFYYCSECGHRLQTYRTHYCPNCGADMREKEVET